MDLTSSLFPQTMQASQCFDALNSSQQMNPPPPAEFIKQNRLEVTLEFSLWPLRISFLPRLSPSNRERGNMEKQLIPKSKAGEATKVAIDVGFGHVELAYI
ncbi:hypothetical protein HPG69_014138 [Diceros bicornis minor]|uniref:Uncharacterized protein n=1 Tax=Diceros bicornis minor TaxID=77932 RepID=A0A7J7FIV9_DICBM|nr:hypothetical protein HPG69_014138 [Diceros bicornis minor]